MGERQHITDQQHLITAIKANDARALKQLYVDNFRKTEVYILQNSGTMPQAKDIYQEAFITVWRNLKEGKFVPQNESAVQGYLYQIAKNKWLDHVRSTRFRKTTTLSEDLAEASLCTDDTAPEPVEEEAQLARTMQAFKQLGEECRKLLSEFYFNKKSMRQLADEFNIEEASARNKKYRCILRLRQLALSPNRL